MTAYPIWKLAAFLVLVLLPGSLLLAALFVAHKKLTRRALVPVPKSLPGRTLSR